MPNPRPILAAIFLTILACPQAQAAPSGGSGGASSPHKYSITVGPQFPHLIGGALDYRLSPKWDVGLDGGGFAYTLSSSSGPVPLSLSALSLKTRWFPFGGSFFLGLAAGFQNASASANSTFNVTQSGQSFAVPMAASFGIKSPYVTPHLGWFWRWGVGFTMGLEVGIQAPSNSSSSLDLSITDASMAPLMDLVKATNEYKKLQSDIEKAGNQLGNAALPHAAVRFGWSF